MEFGTGLVLMALVGLTTAAMWGYENEGSKKWVETYDTCGGSKQSPIDIPTGSANYSSSLGNITMTGYDTTIDMEISNNGHTAKVDLTGNAMISNGGLAEAYKAAQFHFHWGSDDTKGSEHTINGNAYPMEMHIVHYKNSAGSLGAAVGQAGDGLAVLGFMFEISSNDNTAYSNLIAKLADIKNPNSTNKVALTSVALNTLMPSNPNTFFRYSGSLTTPSCNEVVVWTVFAETIKISKAQMAKFRKMLSSEHGANNEHYNLQNNFRPVQQLKSRVVHSNFMSGSSTLTPFTTFSCILTVLISFMFVH